MNKTLLSKFTPLLISLIFLFIGGTNIQHDNWFVKGIAAFILIWSAMLFVAFLKNFLKKK